MQNSQRSQILGKTVTELQEQRRGKSKCNPYSKTHMYSMRCIECELSLQGKSVKQGLEPSTSKKNHCIILLSTDRTCLMRGVQNRCALSLKVGWRLAVASL